jgi:hypothetical protein
LPRIVAASYLYRNFPTTRGWAEMMSQGDLAQYAAMEGSDIEQFMNVSDRAKAIIDGADVAMRTPETTSQWFATVADQILRHADLARLAAGSQANKELVSTLTDASILGWLARFHAHRLNAGVSYSLYTKTGDLFSLDDAIVAEKQAVAAWDQMVAAAGEVYSFDLAFGVQRVGFPRHWKEEAARLHASLTRLGPSPAARPAGIVSIPVRRIAPGQPLIVRATIASATEATKARVRVVTASGESYVYPMAMTGPAMFQAKIPGAAAPGRLQYSIEANEPSGQTESVNVLVTADREAPKVQLLPVSTATPGADLEISAKAEDSSGVKVLRLRYRHVTQYEDYQSAAMTFDAAGGVYRARIPGAFVQPEWDLMYFVEAIDTAGNGCITPDLEREAPYRIVPVGKRGN